MPLVRIDLEIGKSAAYRASVGNIVYDALTDVMNVPEDDRFGVITEHSLDGFIFAESYLGIRKTRDCIFIQITLNEGRTAAQKRDFYKAIADRLHKKLGLRREDLLINLIEVGRENWSFGNGEAQYAL